MFLRLFKISIINNPNETQSSFQFLNSQKGLSGNYKEKTREILNPSRMPIFDQEVLV